MSEAAYKFGAIHQPVKVSPYRYKLEAPRTKALSAVSEFLTQLGKPDLHLRQLGGSNACELFPGGRRLRQL